MARPRSEEHTSELQSQSNLVCRLLLEKKNLFAGRDLYAAHPEQHFDFYKYSPTFAVLFAPLAYLPFALTFLCWTLLNGLLLWRSEEHTSELQSQSNLVCRLLLEKNKLGTLVNC